MQIVISQASLLNIGTDQPASNFLLVVDMLRISVGKTNNISASVEVSFLGANFLYPEAVIHNFVDIRCHTRRLKNPGKCSVCCKQLHG